MRERRYRIKFRTYYADGRSDTSDAHITLEIGDGDGYECLDLLTLEIGDCYACLDLFKLDDFESGILREYWIEPV